MKPLYLFLKTPRGSLKCHWSIEVKKSSFMHFLHFLRDSATYNHQRVNKISFLVLKLLSICIKPSKMEDFWLKSAFLATFPSNSIGLQLTQKIRVLGILMQIIKCPILVVTMKLLIAPRIHILVVLWTFTFPPSFLITL